MSSGKLAGMKWRILLLVLFAGMLFWKGSRASFLGCNPAEAADMVVVMWSMRLRRVLMFAY